MQAAPAIDPGFIQRRVKRPNPMGQWDAETQKHIQEDFDALLRDLVSRTAAENC
ncbi:MAG: hypothetical protein JRE73_16870 [Deltaproteobacteria bacterium]|nr:hypothetical protein [Deltaproteobacteria bacterium]